ncbi:LysR family transcriptional regulator [Brevibacillus ruminantium]|uniref:LysR family transcriptional regulator n=1 Tax=Brevibacillus ruminantium TaxID=2950604 RepID=A0ABY4WFJ3_9BACL|nr:LysR family transcriptional regulator [Brevibacillus ruminantium]USG64898.1 LysR family transcriptional regulator [Brevibacillus ruminantium]
MDIRQLQYFAEVAKQRSFTRAAEVLHVSQPSISKMIKSLETELGVILLDRSERKIELTDAGQLVFEHAQRVLQAMGDLTSSLEELRQVERGFVRLGLLPTVGAFLLPAAIASFKKHYPQIELEMREYSARPLEAQVERGHIDIGLTVLPVDEERFEAIALRAEDLVAIVYPEHWLYGRESINLQELSEESFVLFTEEYAMHDVVRQACLQAGFEPKVAYMSSLWDFVGEMVAAQIGISLVPRSVAQRLNKGRLHVVTLSWPPIDWTYALICRKDRYLSHAARAFIGFVREHVIG